jgi:hypothetical protein
MSLELQNNPFQKEIQDVLQHEIAQRHSYFQLKYFLIGKEPTLQAKMWQCIRELKNRKDSLEALELEIEETKDNLELMDINIHKLGLELNTYEHQEFTKKEIEIKIRQKERQKKAAQCNIKQLEERKKWLEEECRFFLETFKNIEKVEPLKNYDDLESQKQYWGEKLSQKINLKMLSQNQLDTELIETIVALPDDMPIKQQILGTLNLRHINMVRQLKDAMKNEAIEEKVIKEN